MSGTKIGGQKVRDALLKKFGSDYYVKMGQKGGKKTGKKGFALMPREKVAEAGRKGGKNRWKSRQKML